MSIYGEDTELRDMLSQTLESNGSLAKIRAQLRASVFLAFHEDEVIQKKEPLMNNKIKRQLETAEGQLMFCIVHEFLEYFHLDYTLSVYESESYAGDRYQYEGRNKLLDALKLDTNDTVPLLMQLIKIAQDYNVQENTSLKHIKINGDKEAYQNGELKNKILTHAMNETYAFNYSNDEVSEEKIETPRSNDTYEGTSSIAEDSIKGNSIAELKSATSDASKNLTDADISQPILKQEKPKKNKSSLTSLSDLPPLQLNKSRNNDLLPSLYSNDFSDKEMDKLFNADPLDNYEEDFMSDVDVNQSKGKDSRASSVTSEEFDLHSNVDDILKSNNSN